MLRAEAGRFCRGTPLLRHVHGFTLLEVLIALVVLGLALTALVHAASVSTRDFSGLRERSYAGWIAANVLSETRLKEHLPEAGRRDGQLNYAGRQWFWRLQISSTQDAQIRRLDVQVYTDAQRSDPVAQLSGFTGDSIAP